MTSDKKRTQLLFDQWKAELASRDRSYKSVLANFDELFFSLYQAGIEFDAAHETLKEAVAAHMFNRSLAKITYNNMKSSTGFNGDSFEEFVKSWRESIEQKASQAFFQWYQVDGTDKEEDKFGSMSAREYSKQRKYADSFPAVDFQKILDEREKMRDEEPSESEVAIADR